MADILASEKIKYFIVGAMIAFFIRVSVGFFTILSEPNYRWGQILVSLGMVLLGAGAIGGVGNTGKKYFLIGMIAFSTVSLLLPGTCSVFFLLQD